MTAPKKPPSFEAMVDALTQELMKASHFDAKKMSPKAKAVVAGAAFEFLIVAFAALPERQRADAVKGIKDNIAKRVAAMAAALKE